MGIRIYRRDQPQRAFALVTDTHVLIFRHSASSTTAGKFYSSKQSSATSLVNDGVGGAGAGSVVGGTGSTPKCIVEFTPLDRVDMQDYRAISSRDVHGTLGLVTLNNDVFLCVVTQSSRAATLRPGETVQRILNVEFHCLNRAEYDRLLYDHVNAYPTDGLDLDGFEHVSPHARMADQQPALEHPCMALKKLLGGGSFYYSADFDLTKRLQDRPGVGAGSVAIDSLDAGFLWNAYMIQPLVDFRSRLGEREKAALDDSRILTSAIRGFAYTMAVPASASPARRTARGFASNLTLISRLSCRRAGTRFNSRGIDDDGNVANFVETETLYCTDELCFSYVQCRGSVPIFWEQTSGLPGQQKITISRSAEATQPAFDKHFEHLVQGYGDIHVVNLLSEDKPQETQLTRQYEFHVAHSPLVQEREKPDESEHRHVRMTNYDFHAETKGPNGLESASGIKRYIEESAIAFEYYLTGVMNDEQRLSPHARRNSVASQGEVLKQAGVFRTNCLDCLDRTNLVQTIISQIALQIFVRQQGEHYPSSDFWARHSTLWADCGDALSKIYAGTGALKSSFTRSGKMSLAGALADVRKSAQRLYINNFEDKGRQNTIDMLLGRLMGQVPVHLYDPINDYVVAELWRRSAEYTSSRDIHIWVGTFNLNGKMEGLQEDLSPWLCPAVSKELQLPEIAAVAFQEIVELSPQQIMSTDPHRLQMWEDAVRKTLNLKAQRFGEEYVLLRGGQLVGASLSVFVKASFLPLVKNVEGAVKKTGMSGMAGNKGAVALRVDCADTSICFVTAHLAAGFANYEERNQDYRTINHGLRFQRNRSIEDHKTVIWFGDFNYRIGMDNARARSLIEKGDLGKLYENDQLNLQMVHGRAFQYYSEKTPTFHPTYKYNVGTDVYDTSDKARIPAWCDRVVTRGDNLRQIHYDAAPLKFSDHRPVWALFQCSISVVDPIKKDSISTQLYTQRRASVGKHRAGSKAEDESDDGSIIGYDPVEPGLPPASSDKRKWWLDNGMPARSTVKAPSNGHVPNPARPSNPFTPTTEPDWVRIDKTSAPPSRSVSQRVARKDAPGAVAAPPSRTASQRTAGSVALGGVAAPPVQRKLPPPPARRAQPSQPPAKPPRTNSVSTTSTLPQSDGAGDDTVPVQQMVRQQTLSSRKTPPVRPRKPELLRSQSNTSSPGLTASPPPLPTARRANVGSAGAVAASDRDRKASPARRPPPPSAVRQVDAAKGADGGPPLPPRKPTATRVLMDEDPEDELQGWVALKPS